MHTSHQPKPPRGTKPEWANLPRRKCENCGTSYKPQRPNSRFHNDNCRKEYHKHGGAYAKLKADMRKMVTREMEEIAKQVRAIVLEELTKYARYGKVVEDFSPTLRIPSQSKPAPLPNR